MIPDEALSDDFLFPMTSRLSYASSPESDLDLSPEPRAPLPPSRLVKSSSDPSIATQEDTGPGYTAPPPYSPNNHPYKQNFDSHNGVLLPPDHHHSHSHQVAHSKRRSHGDSKYGFSPSSSHDYPSFPHMVNGGMPCSPLAHSPPLQSPPELPPRIDRTIKPPRCGTLGRSAAERLFGKGGDGPSDDNSIDPPNYINAVPHHRSQGSSSLEKHNMKANSYDSVSSYDSFNNRLGPNAHDDLKCGSNGQPLSPRNHDPYRFTRSTAQPIKSNSMESTHNAKPSKPPDYSKYRPGEYKTPPPPKTGQYKPVPPPKPKNYRPPHSEAQGPWGRGKVDEQNYDTNNVRSEDNGMKTGQNNYQHTKSYSVAGGLDTGNFSTHQIGGEDVNGGFDSGHGSSLDRNYNPSLHRGGREGNQYYYNVPAPRDYREPSGGLDLTNREQRGSAFELYKKPSSGGRNLAMQHYLETNMRGGEGGGEVVATARGVFTHEGGTLSSSETGVAIIIPPGALPSGTSQEIYFKVCRDNSMLPPFDDSKDETLLSPLVMCGPHGIKFDVPVELRLPHWASAEPGDSRGFSLKSSEASDRLGSHHKWENISLDNNNSLSANSVSVLVDHF
uniref:Netrin receptor UNC5 n=1 Tax=Timema genevievae TaxID=629358 RepID=A0A7R9PLJ1_TIMGE|nr:unnamed protein product [Timema genevievae]